MQTIARDFLSPAYRVYILKNPPNLYPTELGMPLADKVVALPPFQSPAYRVHYPQNLPNLDSTEVGMPFADKMIALPPSYLLASRFPREHKVEADSHILLL
jgi:hypothetical protein